MIANPLEALKRWAYRRMNERKKIFWQLGWFGSEATTKSHTAKKKRPAGPNQDQQQYQHRRRRCPPFQETENETFRFIAIQ
jgi:hypothetical protein